MIQYDTSYHSLKTRVELNKKRWLLGQGENAFFSHGTLNIVVLYNYVLLENFDCKELLSHFVLGKKYL